MNPARVANVVDWFRTQHARGVFPGGQLVVRRRGVLVVDEAVGLARGFRTDEGEAPVPYTPLTRACVFSAGKPLVALAVALLEHQGRLDVDAPVGTYWKEFAQAGKEAVTVLDVLTHRSGLYLGEIEADWRRYGDREGIVARIERTRGALPRGTLAYQPMGFGWILGEVVRRITGKSIDRIIEEDVLAPAGLDDLRLGVPAAELSSLARSYWVDARPPRLAGKVLTDFDLAQNSPEWLTAVVPGGGTIAHARSLARLYEWLLAGTPRRDGAALIGANVLDRYTTAQVRGLDRTVKVPLVLGRGFQLGWFWPHPFGWWRTGRSFGHGGNFSTVAWGDPTTGLAIAYVTNGNRAPTKIVPRCAPLGSGLRAACVS